ncbi:MAG TPA: 50S ribosomal protein L24 [Armatimonadota bacterium]|jgi:large subunit ribosomal protein L24
MPVKRGDQVMVLSGKDKGKRGNVERSIPSDHKVLVAGVNIITRHQKPRTANPRPGAAPSGGIIKRPAPIHVSKVMLVCPRCDKPTRPTHLLSESGHKRRVCRRCQQTIDEA